MYSPGFELFSLCVDLLVHLFCPIYFILCAVCDFVNCLSPLWTMTEKKLEIHVTDTDKTLSSLSYDVSFYVSFLKYRVQIHRSMKI